MTRTASCRLDATKKSFRFRRFPVKAGVLSPSSDPDLSRHKHKPLYSWIISPGTAVARRSVPTPLGVVTKGVAMKRKTLIALGIASAFACGSASAGTFLCTQESPGSLSISCAEIPSGVLGTMTSAQDVWVPAPPFTTYYLAPAGQDEVALVEFWEESEPSLVTY